MKKKSKVPFVPKKKVMVIDAEGKKVEAILIGTAEDVPAYLLENYGIDILKSKKHEKKTK